MNSNDFSPFVIPFLAGTIFLAVWIPFMFIKWLKNTSQADRRRMSGNIFTAKSWNAVKEIFSECLLHRRIFRFNPLLGYMHMSLAFGWFLLIAVGKLESLVLLNQWIEPIYETVFFRYFYPGMSVTTAGKFFLNLMDLLLVFVLSGVFLAFFKRIRSQAMGMRKTTKHILSDRLALSFLWFVFPLRWLAESLTSGINGDGGFLSFHSGQLLASFLPVDMLVQPAWWAYSIALGGFFFFMPFSRYMHIFTEAGLIFVKHWGMAESKRENGYADFEVNACSRCGICTNVCQLSDNANIKNVQAVYFIRDLRYHRLERPTTENCLMCGRCSQVCPIGINIDGLRMRERTHNCAAVDIPFELKKTGMPKVANAEVLYFAGCMAHLTPKIPKATCNILEKLDINYSTLNDSDGYCCGRPLMQAGLQNQAESIMQQTKTMIEQSGASMLLVSCPSCLKIFNEEYNLDIPVVHHSVFFNNMMAERPQMFRKTNLKYTYHDPCDLGRGSGVFEEPRSVLRNIATLLPVAEQRENSLCCGGSLANVAINPTQRKMVINATYETLAAPQPDYIVTSCALCKKTLNEGKHHTTVIDIAEAVEMSLKEPTLKKESNRKRAVKMVEMEF
ncbi:MAG: (Fe-S)-binding protein [Prolixibacteraceae bacterium]|nr:(Fe-S)-binding protein [Prolixibacteraceae bacterium]